MKIENELNTVKPSKTEGIANIPLL